MVDPHISLADLDTPPGESCPPVFDGIQSLKNLSELSDHDLAEGLRERDVLSLPKDKSVVLLGFRDVSTAMINPDMTVEQPFRASRRIFGPSVLDLDGARHRRVKQPISKSFGNRQVQELCQPFVADAASEVVRSLRAKSKVDLVDDLAANMVIAVTGRLMTLPDETHRPLYDIYRPVIAALGDESDDFLAARAAVETAGATFRKNLRLEQIDKSPLASLHNSYTRGQLSSSEYDSMLMLMFAAATETTIAGISNVLWQLVQAPRLWADLQALSSLELDAATMELLRRQPPLFSTVRFAVSDMEFGRMNICRGTPIQLCIASACRDPRAFDAPEKIKIGRAGQTRIMFGRGNHHCPGLALAVAEITAVLRELFNAVIEISPAEQWQSPTGSVFRRTPMLPAILNWKD